MTTPDQHDAAARKAGREADAWRRPLGISREDAARLDADEPAPLAMNRAALRAQHEASAKPATILPPPPAPKPEAARLDAAPQYREGEPIPFNPPGVE